jgi:hypothetical protein
VVDEDGDERRKGDEGRGGEEVGKELGFGVGGP